MDTSVLELARTRYRLVRKGSVFKIDEAGMNSVTIWPETDTWHWFANNIGGGVREFAKYILHWPDSKIFEEFGEEEVTLTLSFKNTKALESELPYGSLHWDKDDYINGRGVETKIAHDYNIETTKDLVIFPLYNRLDKLVGKITRDKREDANVRYFTYLIDRKPPLWSLKHINRLKPEVDIIIVESTWSCLLLNQTMIKLGLDHKFYAAATLGNSFSEDADYILYNRDIYCLADPDEGGEELKDDVENRKHGKAYILSNDFNVDKLNNKQLKAVAKQINEYKSNAEKRRPLQFV